jgi:uracil-DNA glycosylase family 4
MSIEELSAKIKVCSLCSLSKSRTLAVPGEGLVSAALMLVGEGPGAEEDKKGRPFVGSAGKYLDSLLDMIRLKREDVFITNIVKCRPPENRIPSWEERKACLPYLKAQLQIIRPQLICTLGRTALETLTKMRSISHTHGRLVKENNLSIFVMYHPAAALHNPTLKPVLESDVLRLNEALRDLRDVGVYSSGKDMRLEEFMP